MQPLFPSRKFFNSDFLLYLFRIHVILLTFLIFLLRKYVII